ncbi:MAG: ABC transporter ATP-binding protein [Ardenticatenaceae bacterium]|nr:ABC transporter ATP-binding protein [Ardenticatenaceae bacterium]
MVAIETTGLGKRYGAVTAVSDLSLHVTRGEIYAFLGLNGAGKTTTIRMLLGMIKPTAGEAKVLGMPIQRGRPQPWHSVGYLVEAPYAYPELSVRENLELVRRLRPGTDRQAIDRIIEQLGLTSYATRRADTLSQGNKQRLGLAKAMLHQPALLILDEPANGLDPAGIVEIRNLLTQLAQEQGVTIFMSSHLLAEVARLAHRIGIIHQGKLLQELSAAELQQQRRRRLLVQTRTPQAAQVVLANAGFAGELTANTLILHHPAALDCPDDIATLLVNAGHPPTHLAIEQEDLEQQFLRLVGIA